VKIERLLQIFWRRIPDFRAISIENSEIHDGSKLYNIQRWTVFPRGGHFAPAEEPAAVAGDLIAFFRGLS